MCPTGTAPGVVVESCVQKTSGSVVMTKKWPEDPDPNVNRFYQIYQRWTYCYMGSILTKGAKQRDDATARIVHDDLYSVPVKMKAAFLATEFQEQYNNNNSTDSSTAHSAAVSVDEDEKGSQRKLVAALWHIAAPTFVPAGFCELITVLCQVALPLLVRELLSVLENNPNSRVIREGMPYAVSVFLVTCLNAFGNHRHRHLAMKSGIAMRAATVSILYDRVLRLSPRGKIGLTSGEVTNLIATDTQKLFEVCQEGHLIWALPLSIVLVTVCLLVVMGPTTLVGIVVLVGFVPLVKSVTTRMLSIRQERVKMTDKRVAIVCAMLNGIKVTKLNSYEENYVRRVTEARNEELSHLRKELAVWALTLVLTVISPMIATASTFVLFVLIDEDNVLTASRSFSVLLLFSALRFPINFAGRLLGKATQAYSAVQRISRFLDRELRSSDKDDSSDGEDTVPLSVEEASFYAGAVVESPPDGNEQSNVASFQVSKFNFSVNKGEVLAVCGPVGGGKSSLINGIIGEVPAAIGSTVSTAGSISLVSQDAFILNTTLKENILFGSSFDRNIYERVLDACCLRTDINLLGPSKDMTEIGERGVTLSGGQKQRVSLGRAAYKALISSSAGIICLDDPLSALDASTSKAVFERLIKGPDALFSKSAVVLVTHASHFLNRVDKIIVIAEGKNEFCGTWNDLVAFKADDEKTNGIINFIRKSVQEKASKEGEPRGDQYGESTVHVNKEETTDALMTVEEREHGLASPTTWLLWFKHAGGLIFLSLQVLLMTIDRTAYVAVDYWLARWTSASDGAIESFGIEFPPQTDGREAQYKYLTVYSSLILVSILATIVRSEWVVTGGARASKSVFHAMLVRVLGAPMSYFDSTPMGRVLNRFTYDMEVIDVTLTQAMSMFLISCSWFVAGICVMTIIMPWIGLTILPVTAVYWLQLLYYRKSGSDLQRLDAVSRSPLQAMVSEGLDGAPTIRLFGQQATFSTRFQSIVDRNSSALLNFVSAQRWLGFRIELLGSIVVLVSSLLVISLNDVFRINAGLVGLLILWSSNFTVTLGFMVDTFADAEASITAIERVESMSKIPQEKNRLTEDHLAVSAAWPKHGNLEFDNVCMRYREGLPLALNGLSFAIQAGKKCGIVGRTGAGKSSLTVALFRLVEIEAGSIKVDGVDLSTLGLADVRGRLQGMAIIPQDPFLAGDTLRLCIDPFAHSSDVDILEALKSVRLAGNEDTEKILDTVVEEGGSNYSVGERQLLNLARALLSKPRLLVLDEASSNLDGETDAFIQHMLRTKFGEATQVTIAHRLNTIMDFDQIVVMDAGKAAEVGTPKELLDQEGIFAELVDATGPEGSKALRAMVV